MSEKKGRRATYAKIFSLVVGIITLGLGLYSFFESSWYKKFEADGEEINGYHKICEIAKDTPVVFPGYLEGKTCPSINLERYFVSVIIICFVISLGKFISGFCIDLTSGFRKFVDFGFHIVGAILLVTAGAVYILSSKQIFDYLGLGKFDKDQMEEAGVDFKTNEKLAAGCLAIVQAIVYCVTAFFIIRG